MKPNRFPHRVQIQRDTSAVRDAHGQHTPSWVTIARRWASIRPDAGREAVIGGSVESDVSHIISLRDSAGMRPDDRLLFGERIFEVISVINAYEKGALYDVRCKEYIDPML